MTPLEIQDREPIDGWPNSGVPHWNRSWPGSWLALDVQVERTRHHSSAQLARCGTKSENSVPHLPCFVKVRGLAKTRALPSLP